MLARRILFTKKNGFGLTAKFKNCNIKIKKNSKKRFLNTLNNRFCCSDTKIFYKIIKVKNVIKEVLYCETAYKNCGG